MLALSSVPAIPHAQRAQSGLQLCKSTNTAVKSVRDYGAVGDGIVDDTGAIQAAIDDEVLDSVYFPPGTYRITSQLLVAKTQRLVGDTRVASVILSASAAEPVLRIEGPAVRVHRLEFAGGLHGILVQSAPDVLIEDCHVHDSTGRGIAIQDSTGFHLSHCEIHDVPLQAIDLVFSSNGVVRDCDIRNALHGIQWWGGEGSVPLGVADVRILGNHVTSVTGAGIWGTRGKRVVVASNIVENCGDVGIDYEGCHHGVIDGNVVRNAINGGIATFDESQYLVISDNLIDQEAGNGPGIRFFGAGGDYHHNVTDNIIHTWNSDGIVDDSDALRFSQVHDNYIRIDISGTPISLDGPGNSIVDNYKVVGGV